MKIVVTADMHIHPYRQCSRDGGHDRLLDGLSVLRQSLDLARREGAAWVMAGDFKMPKTFWPQSALTGAHEILREYDDVPKLMVAGNHDARGVGGSGLAPFKDVADVVETSGIVVLGDTMFACAPWDADRDRVRKMVNDARNVDEFTPLIAHAFLMGCALGPDDVRLNKGVPVEEYGDFPVAFFGDVHKGQGLTRRPASWETYDMDDEGPEARDARLLMSKIRSKGPWCGEVFYPGSPYPQNWGERNDGEKGVLVADLATGEIWFHIFTAPRFIHVEIVEGQLEEFLDQQEEGEYEQDFLRIVYSGFACPALDHLRDIKCRSFQLIFRRPVPIESRVEIHAGMNRLEMLTRYVDARALPDGADKARALDAGMRLMG